MHITKIRSLSSSGTQVPAWHQPYDGVSPMSLCHYSIYRSSWLQQSQQSYFDLYDPIFLNNSYHPWSCIQPYSVSSDFRREFDTSLLTKFRSHTMSEECDNTINKHASTIELVPMRQRLNIKSETEDWTGKSDTTTRRKLQNRLNQRASRSYHPTNSTNLSDFGVAQSGHCQNSPSGWLTVLLTRFAT